MPDSTSQSSAIVALMRMRIPAVLLLIVVWATASLFSRYTPTIKEHISTRLSEARRKIPKVKIGWHSQWPDEDPRDRFNASKVALLIEPRPLPHLVPQILHMISVVPPDWRFIFVGTNQSVASVGRSYATKHQQAVGKLDLLVLPAPWEIDTKEKVHRLLTDMRFYNEFLPGVEWLLKYEYDSILTADDRFSGNGGLSIRRVSTIKRVLRFQERYNDTNPEDEWFGIRLWVLSGAKVASGQDGQLAVEDQYIAKAMGFHVRDGGHGVADSVWKDPGQRKTIFDYCPELSLIMDMKLERERCPGDNLDGTIGGSTGVT
ncbi:hypothetical protein F4679DRAFT_583752 [Xylaria curta]|nr:hypothetical protein F4679DRAFT_583752 [Xylaria curta]